MSDWDDEDDEDTPLVSRMLRVLEVTTFGGRRKCEGCGDWIQDGEERAKVIYLFPEAVDASWEAAGSYMSPGPGPVHQCMQCLSNAQEAGEVLIEPKEPT